jgi:hypothetical protein
LRQRFQLAGVAKGGIFGRMADSEEKLVTLPLMLPIRDKEGTGWHVIIRHHAHERRVGGFATKDEALKWIASRFNQVDR